jgi:hypothetical protein
MPVGKDYCLVFGDEMVTDWFHIVLCTVAVVSAVLSWFRHDSTRRMAESYISHEATGFSIDLIFQPHFDLRAE